MTFLLSGHRSCVDNTGMAKTFRPSEPDQQLLLPPSLADWVPEHHLARFVSDVVDSLDLTAFEDTYDEERGYPPYHPRMMGKVLLYGYCTGVYSSRKMARQLEDSVAFRFLAAGNQPDFRTLSDFRKRHGPALAGLVQMSRVAIDGTKMKANASKHKAMSYGRMQEKDVALRQEVAELVRRAEQADQDEDQRDGAEHRGEALPAELAQRETRLQKLAEAKAALEADARQRAKAEGKEPDRSPPPPKTQYNFTDPESKIQKTSDGFIQGYNAQAAVDAHAQIIVAQHVTAAAPDVQQLPAVVAAITARLHRKPKEVLADAGYWSEANAQLLEGQHIAAYIATTRQPHGERLAPAPRGRPPKDLSVRDRMARTLRTVAGRAVYACRRRSWSPCSGRSSTRAASGNFSDAGCTTSGRNGRSSVRRITCSSCSRRGP
jgi:transposase